MITLKENSPLKEELAEWSKIFPDVLEHSILSKKFDISAFIGTAENVNGGRAATVVGGSAKVVKFAPPNSINVLYSVHSSNKDLRAIGIEFNRTGIVIYLWDKGNVIARWNEKSIHVHDYVFDTRKSYKGLQRAGTVELSLGKPEWTAVADVDSIVYADRMTLALGEIKY